MRHRIPTTSFFLINIIFISINIISINTFRLHRCNQIPIMSKRKMSMSVSSNSKMMKLDHIFKPETIHDSRIRYLTENKEISASGECVVYWMTRDQRVSDNHSLLCAQEIASRRNIPIRVVFNLVPKFLEATIRQYSFMIGGLKEVENTLASLNVPFHLIFGDPNVTIPQFLVDMKAAVMITDFSPLRVNRGWTTAVARTLDETSSSAWKIPCIQVDAHNIVPCWVASPKLEYGARTIRSKIQKLLPQYLVPFPEFHGNGDSSDMGSYTPVDWKAAMDTLEINRDVEEITWIKPGEQAGKAMLQSFCEERLKDYAEKRNDPNEECQSNLSPYLHFGQLSAQRAVLAVKEYKRYPSSADAFVEEVVVRRELSDNFCFYNPRYDSLEGCNDWAKETLRVHAADARPVLYTRQQLENAQTHDDLWNASQIQMMRVGKLHGFLRMYWAKKILEWASSPEEALKIAIYLNDKYNLDGRDPNGYVGCMWSIGGIHDQGWGERAIFGKIRYMNYKGCQRKFNVPKYVAKFPPAADNAQQAIAQGNVPDYD